MSIPKDTDQFLVDIRHGHHYHVRGCLATTRYLDEYRKLSYGEIRAIRTYDGEVFEPDVCVRRDPVKQVPIIAHDWVSPENMIGDNIVVGENLVLGIHAHRVGRRWEYAMTTWWYHVPTVVAVFERDNLWEVD